LLKKTSFILGDRNKLGGVNLRMDMGQLRPGHPVQMTFKIPKIDYPSKNND